MVTFKIIVCVLLGYIIGSINFSVLLSQIGSQGDVRKYGSGNAGATNMARVYGLGAGFLTLFCDMLKTAVALLLGHRLLGDWGLAAAGMACILGHCFPLFHHFQGGKGISVGAIIGLAINWRVLASILAIFLLVAFLSKKVSLGSITAAASLTISVLLLSVNTPKLILAFFTSCIAIFQHRGNVRRLIDGTEPDFKIKKSRIDS